MAHTAHKNPDDVKEHHDSCNVLAEKMQELEHLVRNSKHIVVFTGAGISTSAGISDFRGPTGVWTRKAEGKEPIVGTPAVRALPTKTHMALVQLHRLGMLKYVISQNCDGLHRRSGLPACAISELHGNGNVEICEDCGRRYFRDFKCDRRKKTFDHFTGRFCQCDGRLLNSTIDFGQSLPTQPLERGEAESAKADLHIVLGSSLTVRPACTLPETTARRGGKLVIVNLQHTPLTPKAALHLNAPTDVVMEMLMDRLEIPIPPFRLQRRIIFAHEEQHVIAKAVDVHDPQVEIGVLSGVDWQGTVKSIPESEKAKAIWQHVVHRHPSRNLDVGKLHPTLHFVGHYGEPPIQLDVNLSDGGKDISISFDPLAGEWAVDSVNCLQEVFPTIADLDTEYGQAHRRYVVDKRRDQGNSDAEKLIEQEFQKSRCAAEAWACEEARGRARDRAGLILKNHKEVKKLLNAGGKSP